MVPVMGAGWCPPGMLGVGIGGTAEKAMLMAKEALLDPIDIHELQERGAASRAEELRLELYEKINRLGIGAQGLGGLTTVLDVKVKDFPTHAANKAVAIIPNCAATRHAHFTLDGSGPARIEPPRLEDWPEVTREVGGDVRRVDQWDEHAIMDFSLSPTWPEVAARFPNGKDVYLPELTHFMPMVDPSRVAGYIAEGAASPDIVD